MCVCWGQVAFLETWLNLLFPLWLGRGWQTWQLSTDLLTVDAWREEACGKPGWFPAFPARSPVALVCPWRSPVSQATQRAGVHVSAAAPHTPVRGHTWSAALGLVDCGAGGLWGWGVHERLCLSPYGLTSEGHKSMFYAQEYG